LGIFHSFAQGKKDSLNIPSKKSTTSNDRIVLDYFDDIWQSAPSGIKVNSYSPGVDIYGMGNIAFGKSHFSLGIGFGFSVHNMRSDATPVNETKFDSTSGKFITTGNTVFEEIPGMVNNRTITYNNNKFSLTYFEIPIEIRFRHMNQKKKAFKFSVGGNIGYLVSDHTKYKGIQYAGDISDPNLGTATVKYKTYKISNLNPMEYSATVRLGYGMFNIFGTYSFSKTFKNNKGPQMFPLSVGISITPF
jgi:hypothetical protein